MADTLRRPVCNNRQHTAPRIMGWTFPLCWRCSSMILAAGIAQLGFGPVISPHWSYVLAGSLLLLAGGYDGYRSYFTPSGTTNLNRVIYGVAIGGGLFLISNEYVPVT